MKSKPGGRRLDKYITLSDAEIIVLYRQGDEWAGTALYYRYQTGMLHYATVIVGPYYAQDVMQDTWIAMINGIRDGSYKEEQRFNKYIKSTVLRQALVTLHVQRCRGATDAAEPEYPDDGLSAEEVMLMKEPQGLLLRALKRVGARATRIFVLHLQYGYSFKEIGVIMNILEGTVRVFYFRTLRELGRLLLPYRAFLQIPA